MMRRQVSATGVSTFIMVAGAGILLTAKLHLYAAGDLFNIPLWILWLAEVLAYVAALLIWTPGISPAFLLLGMVVIFMLRTAIAGGAAMVDILLLSSEQISETFISCLSDPLTRACSVIFALMAAYPLRALLPQRGASGTPKVQSPKQASAKPAANAGGTFLFGASKGQQVQGRAQTKAAPSPLEQNSSPSLPAHLLEQEIAIPIKVIIPQLPAGVLRSDVAERALQGVEEMQVGIPLSIIVPQLKEALIQISVAALLSFLPKGWADTPMAGAEDMVELPLEIVIPQLPEEALQLPPASPPEWATVDQEQEKVLFAQV